MKHLKFLVELDIPDDLDLSSEIIYEIKQNLETNESQEVGIRNVSVKEVIE